MKKLIFSLIIFYSLVSQTLASTCLYEGQKEGFWFGFTFYGAPDKSYVVTKNTFTNYQLTAEKGNLLGAEIKIDPSSLDTSADMNNGMGSEWPTDFALIRNLNTVTSLFLNFTNPSEIEAKIVKIDNKKAELAVTMNGVTKNIMMDINESNDGLLTGKGTLDILDFNSSVAWTKFEEVCQIAWHRGKSWSTIDLEFRVPVKKSC
jgi:hypothetical protein